MRTFSVIIIDDERLAREEVKRSLSDFPEFEVLAEAKNYEEAKTAIENFKPDLIFLDIQMPGKSGFDLLESLDEVPQVVFTTAFNQYAAKAFDIDALDYLVKPLRQERFGITIERIRKRLANNGSQETATEKQVFIKDGSRCFFVQLKDVYLIESADNYVKLYFNDRKVLIKRTLNALEEILDSNIFFRINRNQIINTKYITEINSLDKGKLQVRLHKGEPMEVSLRQSVLFKTLNGI
ncbi:MAG: LytTR family transcriptional regulator DNA-binding domain-containing protein [Chitinophagaceae bacterium]